ncbi:porin [Herbaspirillum sp. LeCh32-8]|uniref:porin n=1 Tax=Herbaspirillum sp. LeCh32-8 TaxID=2821356 RepID=UPI001AEA2435|nr:porin [Herbaspirillum sp. LeCh32-8]MBP0598854.1 porin [Herbaspirillum sp. LeCh32-8]
MKKKLLALAAFGVFAGSANAQSSVTIYGVIDMAIQHENNGRASKVALDSGGWYGSRIGFKGTEDLGGGLKANFQLESGFNADDGGMGSSGVLFNRLSWVGLSGAFGSLNVGRQYAPIFLVADNVDPFDAGMTGGRAGVSTYSGGMLSIFGTSFRTSNTVNYTTNNLSGFKGSLAYTFGEAAGSTTANRAIGLSGAYENGPVYVGAALQRTNDVNGRVASKELFIGGTYDFHVVKAHLGYQKNTSDSNVTTPLNNKGWMVGATVPLLGGNVLASYIRSTDNTVATANKGSQWALGYTYDISKRTTLYTSYSRNTNDANANIGGLAAANGLTDSLFNVGVRHKF